MKAFIYKIKNTVTNDIYIGSTIQELKNRFKSHKNNAKIGKTEKLYQCMRENGIENFSIQLLQELTINNKKELHKQEKKYYDLLQPSLNIILHQKNTEIKDTGRIYCVYYSDKNIFYIGSTTSELDFHLTQHKTASLNGTTPLYTFMREKGIEKFTIECIEDHIPTENLIIRENHWINELKPPLNKNTNLCLTEQERDRLKYIKNKEKILKRVTNRRLLKRDEINAQKREHYNKNKDEINEKDKQKREALRTVEVVIYTENPKFTDTILKMYTVFQLKEIAKKLRLRESPRLKEPLIHKILATQERLFD